MPGIFQDMKRSRESDSSPPTDDPPSDEVQAVASLAGAESVPANPGPTGLPPSGQSIVTGSLSGIQSSQVPGLGQTQRPTSSHTQYELVVVQNPRRARTCGFTAEVKDRRMIDPPPIVQLFMRRGGQLVPAGEVQSRSLTCHVALYAADGLTDCSVVLNPRDVALDAYFTSLGILPANAVATPTVTAGGRNTSPSSPAPPGHRTPTSLQERSPRSSSFQSRPAEYSHESTDFANPAEGSSSSFLAFSSHAQGLESQSFSSFQSPLPQVPATLSLANPQHPRPPILPPSATPMVAGSGLTNLKVTFTGSSGSSTRPINIITTHHLAATSGLRSSGLISPAGGADADTLALNPLPSYPLQPAQAHYSASSHSRSQTTASTDPSPQSGPEDRVSPVQYTFGPGPVPSPTGVTVSQPSSWNSSLVGSLVAVPFVAFDMQSQPGVFFIFNDLSIRMQGIYRLQFTLFEINPNTPVMPRLATVQSEPFEAFPPKQFPGVSESTELTKHLARQGASLHVRRDLSAHRSFGSSSSLSTGE